MHTQDRQENFVAMFDWISYIILLMDHCSIPTYFYEWVFTN